MKSQIEFIRKPQDLENAFSSTMKSGKSFRSFNSTGYPFNSFKSEEYLKQKFRKYSHCMNQTHLLDYDRVQDIDTLMVRGKSQFDLEIDMLNKDGLDGAAFYSKEVPIKKKKSKRLDL